jgi:hypothetical protein
VRTKLARIHLNQRTEVAPIEPQETAEGPPSEDSEPIPLPQPPRHYRYDFPRQRGFVELDEHHIELNFPCFYFVMNF